MKNKKGFTLIELLVVIALMLSILAIAIVSFINVSNKKKEEAWEKVKQQMELAAEEYLENNEFYLESLATDEGYVRVSIGKLVEEDYLNKVVNPVNGKSLHNCDYVEITINASGYQYKYTENKDNKACNVGNYIVVSEVGAPFINVFLENSPNGNNDYYIDDVNILAKVGTNGNGPIKEIKYCTTNKNCNSYKDIEVKSGKENIYYVVNKSLKNNSNGVDGNKVETLFVATNSSGKSVTGSVTYKKDTKNPDCVSNTGSTSWTKGSRTINQYCLDETSGCISNPVSKIFKDTKKEDHINIKDKAGNTSSCLVNVYVDNNKPKCGSNNGSSIWTNNDRTITQECIDDESGCTSITKRYNKDQKTDTVTISDNVGNTNNCDVNVYVDKTKPSCTISFSGTKGTNGWYIQNNVDVSLENSKNDSLSDIKNYGLTTSNNLNYNNKTTGVQSNETNGTTWYGYVKDAAGNENKCNKTVKLEKEVSISFNSSETNKQKSLNDKTKNKKNTSNGEKVFNGSYSTCGFGECSNIKCKTNKDKTTSCSKNYYAKACMYVSDYSRVFNVSAVSLGDNVKVYADKGYDNKQSAGMNRIESHYRYSCDLSKDYYVRGCGNASGGHTNVTSHVYQYTSLAGNKSKKITLYVDYGVNCEYASY